MSPLASYDFLPYLRRGAAAELRDPDPLAGAVPYRGGLGVKLQVSSGEGAAAQTTEVGTAVQLHGPGDVIGIDPRHVIRTDPRDGTPSFEPNYFPSIEFEHPDFPWLFTPAAATAAGRLRPWLVLVVLTELEFSSLQRPPNPLPAIQVTSVEALPDLGESWAWAHAQVTGGDSGDLAEIIVKEPGRALSRLVCARRLEPSTRYTAFLVPAFDLGVKAGLGGDSSPQPSDPTAKRAWTGQEPNVELPVYYQFEFGTSEQGDFESLVRQLEPRKLPPEVGTRPMAVDRPGWGGVRGAGGPLGLGGALRSLSTAETPWVESDRANFTEDLSEAVNRGAAPIDDPAEDPRIVPPLYGRWHAARSTIDPGQAGWVNELNSDPRQRASAGVGTRVVLDQRGQLMTSAWEQVKGIEEANQLLRQAQLSAAASKEAHQKHLEAVDEATTIHLAAPTLRRLLASPRTVAAELRRTRIPAGLLSPAFRRLARPLGPLSRRQGGAPLRPGGIISQVNDGEVRVLGPPRKPDGLVSLEDLSESLFPRWVPRWLRPLLQHGPLALLVLALIVLLVLLLLGLLFGFLRTAVAIAVPVALLLLVGALLARRGTERFRAAALLRFDALTPRTFERMRPRPDFHLNRPGDSVPIDAAPGTDSPDAAAFRRAAGRLAPALTGRADPPVRPHADLPALAAAVLAGLDPAKTIPAHVDAQVSVDWGALPWQPDYPLGEIWAAPEFLQPMYEPLRDLSQDLLLPGLDAVPPNTLGLLREDHAFIEAYLVGANHEMSRQLLWNGYPTDQRGSYFRQFWDVRGYVPRPGDPSDEDELREQLKDVPPLHRWPRNLPVGENENRPEISPQNLILLVRGDLMRRYPNAVIYAAEAKWDSQQERRLIGEEERYPLFRGTLTPDVTFFGFDLDAATARGSSERTKPQGWFFVFQELPSEPRFGLDAEPDGAPPAIEAWTELSWAHFPAAAPFAPASAQPAPLAIADEPDEKIEWGADSAQTAWITMRRPVRVAIHADAMVPQG